MVDDGERRRVKIDAVELGAGVTMVALETRRDGTNPENSFKNYFRESLRVDFTCHPDHPASLLENVGLRCARTSLGEEEVATDKRKPHEETHAANEYE